MATVYTWLVLAYFLIVAHGQSTSDVRLADPGLKIRFTKSGLNYGAQEAVDVLAKQVKGMRLPDVSGDARVSVVGKISYTISGMTLTSFSTPASTVTTQPFGWSLRNIGAKVDGNWKYNNHGFIHISDHGSFDVTLSGWSISVTVEIGVNAQHRPTVSTSTCNCYADSTRVKFHGGASWLYNLFSDNIENSLKKQLQSKLCAAVKKDIDVNGNALLQTLKVTVPLDKKVELDYGLIQAPSFTADAMESYHKGEIFWSSDKKEAPFPAPPLPEVTSDKMVTFWVSEYVINTLGYVDFKHQAIKYNLTKNDLPPDEQKWLNTTCSSITCIGYIVPELKSFCPNCSIEIHMAVSKAPFIQISQDKGISGSSEGIIEFYVSKSPNDVKFTFSVKTSVALDLTIAMKGMSIVGEVKEFRIANTTLVSSKIGDKFMTRFPNIMSGLLNLYVKPQLEKLMQQGIELPHVEGMQFVDPDIKLVQNAVLVMTNLKYTA